jgi:hypothetical protein
VTRMREKTNGDRENMKKKDHFEDLGIDAVLK